MCTRRAHHMMFMTNAKRTNNGVTTQASAEAAGASRELWFAPEAGRAAVLCLPAESRPSIGAARRLLDSLSPLQTTWLLRANYPRNGVKNTSTRSHMTRLSKSVAVRPLRRHGARDCSETKRRRAAASPHQARPVSRRYAAMK